mmetsp:Transcript_29342/g.45634  ORF Transcript_29342/g.45634 Transcript_29342/m.45634 type:complete len:554 (-) Transcript_29342:2366-4027(-)
MVLRCTTVSLILLPIATYFVHSYNLGASYAQARDVRALEGHETALPLYQDILSRNPNDCTAASLIAGNEHTPKLQDKACGCSSIDDVRRIRSLQKVLLESDFTRKGVAELFGVESEKSFVAGPIYVKPVVAGTSCPEPLSTSDSPLKCLVKMFLLGFCERRAVLNSVFGDIQIVDLLLELGLAFPCTSRSIGSKELIVPYVQIFPMDAPVQVEQRNGYIRHDQDPEHLFFATDFHPSVLSSTTVGTNNDGAVMYIGPDSLALVQHMPQLSPAAGRPTRVLDLCCGSGIQAITALAVLSSIDSVAEATCVDINGRALRFTEFNSILNGLSERVTLQIGDLSQVMIDGNNHLLRKLKERSNTFDILLSNPPFLPVPAFDESNEVVVSIARRYGFFSDGGSNGELILQSILKSCSSLMNDHSIIGIVSEFMNPGVALCDKIEQWWNQQTSLLVTAKGILFTNEYPISGKEYAARRAANDAEAAEWMNHLTQLQIELISPGLLFIRTERTAHDAIHATKRLQIEHLKVPKTADGSIWTPYNKNALIFTCDALKNLNQ